MWLSRKGRAQRWTDEDKILTLAHTQYEDGLCPGCGHPKHRAWDEDSTGYYERDELVCKGCAAREEGHGPHPGRKQFVTFEAPPGSA